MKVRTEGGEREVRRSGEGVDREFRKRVEIGVEKALARKLTGSSNGPFLTPSGQVFVCRTPGLQSGNYINGAPSQWGTLVLPK